MIEYRDESAQSKSKRVKATVATVVRSLELALAAAFVIAVLFNFANVAGRYVLGISFLGAEEIQVFIMIAMGFLGAAIASWRDEHLRVDVLAEMLPQKPRHYLYCIELSLVFSLCAYLAYFSFSYVERMFLIGRRSDMANVPMWIPHGFVALGLVLIALTAGIRLLTALRSSGKKMSEV